MNHETIKVLLVDDDEDDYVLTKALFSQVELGSYDLQWAPSYEEGLRIAALGEHDVCLVDFYLGELSGIDLIRAAREARLTIPMILLTGAGSHDLDAAAMLAGATDYLIKNETSPSRLERTVRYAVHLNMERCRMEAELVAFAEKHAAVAEIGRLALVGGQLKVLFGAVAGVVARTLGVDYSLLLELSPQGDALVLRGWNDEYPVDETAVCIGKESQAGFTLLCNEAVVVEDLQKETRFRDTLLSERAVKSGISVVIRGPNGPYGVLSAHTTSLRKFSMDDATFLIAVANVLAEAIARRHAEDELRTSQDSLKQSETKFRALFENALDAVMITNDQAVYVDLNPAACRLLGASYDEIIGRTVVDFTDYGQAEAARQWQLFLKKGTMRALFALRRADGESREVDVAATANFVPGLHLSILRDVTEHRDLEAQLQQSQKLESVGLLAGGIAHDFNNLLTVISGYSEMALRGLDETQPLARNLEEVKRAAERASSLTRQLLAFSRKQVLQPKILDLNAIITVISKMIQRLVGEDMELCIVPGDELGSVKADPGQLEQVIMNLSINARDSMPDGGKIIIETANVYIDDEFARTHTAIATGWHVMLNISDTGHGIDQKTIKHIFEPFFTTKEQGKGTGLGLATVYGIVKQSGGSIWVSSEIDEGTSFKIYLPTVNDEISEAEPPVRRHETAGATETILLAEDDEMVRHLTSASLKLCGYSVLETANGSEALSISKQHKGPIHLLLTDVVMPRMSGKELADQLLILRPDTLVLYMSGYANHSIVHQGVLDGNIDFIEKPFTPESLARKVAEVLDHRVCHQ